MIGTVNLYMQSLCYKIELQEQLVVTDYKGQEMGQSVSVCDVASSLARSLASVTDASVMDCFEAAKKKTLST